MKILVVTPYFTPHKGGSQQYAEELHYHLMQADSSITVDVLCYNSDNAKAVEKYRGFTIYRIPCWQPLTGQFAIPNYITLFKTLKKLFKKNRYDLINSHTRFFESSWWTPFAAKFFKTKSLLTDHCAHHPTHTSPLVNTIARIVDTSLVPIITRFYDGVSVTNNATFEFVKSLGVHRPHIIYGGVDTRYFSPRKRQSERIIPTTTQSLHEKDILVTFVGRMIPSKGPHLLFDAAKTVVKKYPQVKVVFAGDGIMRTRLSGKKAKNISFLGSLEKESVSALMANSDIIVHPSLHHEGFPNVLLEAGASGCAVIATNKGGTKEIIEHTKTGILVEPTVSSLTNALVSLIEQPTIRKKLGRNIRKKVFSTYDWKNIIVSYTNLIRHLLSTR